MTALRALLLSPAAAGLLAVALLSLVVWFAGPLLPIGEPRLFDPPLARLAAIAALAGLWLLFLGLRFWRRRRANAALIDALAAPDPTRAAIDAEAERLREKFAAALGALRKLRFGGTFGGRRYLYELPWFVFIGPPGAGKTTALTNCGLDFPLARDGGAAVSGAAGTRDCDWMFTDRAVFIDTAGRYVTQDSDAEVDRAAWTAFLDLLRRHRPAEPVNGVIVAISLADLAGGDAAALDRHAVAVRRGLLEIAGRMGARTPVYVMLTKLDLLAGFDEFFQGLDQAGREAVWGVTFPLEGPADPRLKAEADLGRIEEEMGALLARLGEAQFARLQEEPDLAVRARVFGFPSQFSSLTGVLARFLRQVFAPDRYSEPLLLRGFYFTSATQEGQPIDRLIGSMAREFGLRPQAMGVLAPRKGRAYFLRGLLEQVVFPEAGLVARGGRRTGARLGRAAAFAAAAAAPLALGAGLWTVHGAVEAEAARLVGVFAEAEVEIRALDPERVAEARFERAAPALDRLRAERDRLAAARAPLAGLGVADLDALRAEAERAYLGALDDLFRPRAMFALEREMDRLADQPGPLYDALKAYLMLAGQGPLDADFVRGIMARLWAAAYDPALQRDLIAGFAGHLDALLAGLDSGRIGARSVNEAQVAAARVKARDVSPGARAFALLAAQGPARALRPWTPLDPEAGGRAAAQALLRASGAELGAPIPGLFTREGFHAVFLPNADAAVAAALSESWVLNEQRRALTLEETTAARRAIRAAYAERAVAHWRGLLDDLRVTPFRDAAHAAEVLRLLTGGGSPLRGLLQDVARQTDLSAAAGPVAPVLLDFGAAGRAAQAAAVAGALGGGPAGEGTEVSAAFADLRGFVGVAGASPLEGVIARLAELRGLVADMAERRVADMAEIARSGAAVALAREADGAPPEMRRMVREMLASVDTTVAGGLREQLTREWEGSVAPVCRTRLTGRYPFAAGEDAPLGDIAVVLGPDGAIDRFFRDRLAPLVDTTQPEWRWTGLGAALGVAQDRLAFFQSASRLREAFFPAGAQRPQAAMRVFQHNASAGVRGATLAIGGESASFEPGKRNPTPLTWPGLVPEDGVEAVLMLDAGDRDLTGAPLPPVPVRVAETGPWGLFRLIDRAEFRVIGAGERVHLGLGAPGGRVVVELAMDSAVNPFALRAELKAFRCPATL